MFAWFCKHSVNFSDFATRIKFSPNSVIFGRDLHRFFSELQELESELPKNPEFEIWNDFFKSGRTNLIRDLEPRFGIVSALDRWVTGKQAKSRSVSVWSMSSYGWINLHGPTIVGEYWYLKRAPNADKCKRLSIRSKTWWRGFQFSYVRSFENDLRHIFLHIDSVIKPTKSDISNAE